MYLNIEVFKKNKIIRTINPKRATNIKSPRTLSGGTGEDPTGWIKVN